MFTEIDYRNHLKDCRLTVSQKQLLNAITLEPTAHLYAGDYMGRHHLTRGRIAGALRRLVSLGLIRREGGVWLMYPSGRLNWYKAVLTFGPEKSETLRWGPRE